jgi:hypothetical protein
MIVFLILIIGVVIYLVTSEKKELKNEVKNNIHIKRMVNLFSQKEKIAIIVFFKMDSKRYK